MAILTKNMKRIQRAKLAAKYYRVVFTKDYKNEPENDLIIDMITNLLHYAQSLGLDARRLVEVAKEHLDTEGR